MLVFGETRFSRPLIKIEVWFFCTHSSYIWASILQNFVRGSLGCHSFFINQYIYPIKIYFYQFINIILWSFLSSHSSIHIHTKNRSIYRNLILISFLDLLLLFFWLTTPIKHLIIYKFISLDSFINNLILTNPPMNLIYKFVYQSKYQVIYPVINL